MARRDVRAGAPPFAPPGAWLGPIAGGALVLWIVSRLTAIVFAVAALAYVVRKRTARGAHEGQHFGATQD